MGDSVKPRVVEIDRRKKRITASLQSDAMAERERQALEVRSGRKQRKLEKEKSKNIGSGSGHYVQEKSADPTAVTKFTNTEVSDGAEAVKGNSEMADVDESELSKGELKRKRKLERRAQRRIQKELTGVSA